MAPKSDIEWIEKNLEDEKEWRREMWKEVKLLNSRFNALKVKVYTISGGVAVITSLTMMLVAMKIRH